MELRDALYYPYIHFRDEAWVRSTLLFFPHILRMAPKQYGFRDSEFIRDLMDTEGVWGEPLVSTYPLDTPDAYRASSRLAERFRRDLDDESFVRSFDREATLREFGNDDFFQIHRSKFSYVLANVLEDRGLIWRPRSSHHRREAWYAVHPRIGEVVMSTAAFAASKERGCHVLTDDNETHLISSRLDEDQLYDAILHDAGVFKRAEKVTGEQIGELVISTTFDLSRLTAADFAALSRNLDALYEFSALLSDEAQKIPEIGDAKTRDARAKEAATRIIDSWEDRRRTWGGFMKNLFKLDSLEEAKGMATDALQFGIVGGAAGTSLTGTLLGAVPGLAVGMVLHKAKAWKDAGSEGRRSPTHFLTKVSEHGGIITASR